MQLSNKILLGMAAGIGAGIVFGARMSALDVVGQIFLGLLQMTVLPYITVSLISAVGTLTRAQASALARYGAIVLLLLWGLTLVLIALASLAFPQWQSASYFSPSLLEPPVGFDFIAHFLPSNIYQALATGAVPAAVIFSVLMGVALIGKSQADELLRVVNSVQGAIGDMAGLVMKTAPLGVFAIAASAAGSLDHEAVKGLYVYLVTLLVLALTLTFWVFPMLVKSLTKFRYGEVLYVSREALITAFATGNLFVVLPVIAENTRKLFLASFERESAEANLVEVVVPVSFSLPVAGKLFALLYVLFAGWFSGEQVASIDYPGLLLTGLVDLFGSSYAAVPALLHNYRIPPELFELYLVAENIFSNRLGAMTSVMFVVALAILTTTGAHHKWQWRPRVMLRFVLLSLALMALLSLALRFLYGAVGHDYRVYDEFISRDLLLPAAASRVLSAPPAQAGPEFPHKTLARIQARKLLRVGYYRDWLPYAFHNKDGDLVGLDVELAHQLARDLGVAVEFVRVYRRDVQKLLANGYLDMAASVAMTPAAIEQYTLSDTHFSETLSLLVRKEKRAALRDWQEIGGSEQWHLGVPNAYFLAGSLRNQLPAWQVEEIASPRAFVKGQQPQLDAIVFGAAGASAWTLLYPEFGVVVPQPALPAVPMALPLAANDLEFMVYVTQWLRIRRADGTLKKLSDYWIQGKPLHQPQGQRWNLWDQWFNDASVEQPEQAVEQ